MKHLKKMLSIAATSMVMAASASAQVNIDGVIWTPGSVHDFNSFSIAEREFIDPTTGILSGYGYISQIDGVGVATFCPGCDVTFQFSGFTPVVADTLPTTAGETIGYAGGTVDVYVSHDASVISSIDPNNPYSLTSANTDNGSLFLALAGHNFLGTSFTGSVEGFGTDITGLTGLGLLDVVGGDAANNFNTNLQTNGADISFSNSFTEFTNPGSPDDAVGTGNFHGATIPEPTSVMLVGLGLLGFALARVRKAK